MSWNAPEGNERERPNAAVLDKSGRLAQLVAAAAQRVNLEKNAAAGLARLRQMRARPNDTSGMKHLAQAAAAGNISGSRQGTARDTTNAGVPAPKKPPTAPSAPRVPAAPSAPVSREHSRDSAGGSGGGSHGGSHGGSGSAMGSHGGSHGGQGSAMGSRGGSHGQAGSHGGSGEGERERETLEQRAAKRKADQEQNLLDTRFKMVKTRISAHLVDIQKDDKKMNVLKTLLKNKENAEFDRTLKEFFPHVVSDIQSMDKLGFAPPPSRRNYQNDISEQRDEGQRQQQGGSGPGTFQPPPAKAPPMSKEDAQTRRAQIMAMVMKKKMEANMQNNNGSAGMGMNRIGN